MGNPYAPTGPVRHANEVRNPVDDFVDRLVTLGADRAEVDEWLDEIDLDSAEFHRVSHMSDDEIRFHLEAVSGELAGEADTTDDAAIVGTMTASAPQVPAPADGDADGLVDLPADLLGQNIPEILAWVSDDPKKAGVVLELESLTDKPRVTLTSQLREITGDSPG